MGLLALIQEVAKGETLEKGRCSLIESASVCAAAAAAFIVRPPLVPSRRRRRHLRFKKSSHHGRVVSSARRPPSLVHNVYTPQSGFHSAPAVASLLPCLPARPALPFT
jgi:hypothetical protein